MNNILLQRLLTLSLMGGFFAILTFIHFFIDWIFQSHAEAMVKHNHPLIRAKHCLIYTAPFIGFLYYCHLQWYFILGSGLVLFFSHFVEDTYLPVLLWAKYIRRPPDMKWKILKSGIPLYNGNYPAKLISPDGTEDASSLTLECGAKTWRETIMMETHYNKFSQRKAQQKLDHGGFMEFASTPIGKILMIAIDQIIHIVFLLPIAYLLVGKWFASY